MSTYDRFFRVTSGPLMDAAVSLVQERREAFKACNALCQELGATRVHSFRDGRFAGFKFDTPPDAGVWKRPNSHGLFWPRKNTKAGRDIHKRIAALPKMRDLSYAVEAVGLTPHFPVLIDQRCGKSSAAFGSPDLGVMFVRIPWRDADPGELADYKRQRDSEKRTRWCATLDHLCWEPTTDMVEVKEWEVMREIELLNAELDQRRAQS